MKLLIDNIKRTIIFKDNKAFYKNKKLEVDVTLFFKKSKDGISVLKKKYSHMLVSENKKIIYGGAMPVDPLQFKFSTEDIDDVTISDSTRFRKLISLYLMAEIYTSDGILNREIDKVFIEEIVEKKGEVEVVGESNAKKQEKAKAKTDKKAQEDNIEEEEEEIGKWELVKLTLSELIDFIINNTYNLDAVLYMFKDKPEHTNLIKKYNDYKYIYIKNVNKLVNNIKALYSAILKQERIKETYEGGIKNRFATFFNFTRGFLVDRTTLHSANPKKALAKEVLDPDKIVKDKDITLYDHDDDDDDLWYYCYNLIIKAKKQYNFTDTFFTQDYAAKYLDKYTKKNTNKIFNIDDNSYIYILKEIKRLTNKINKRFIDDYKKYYKYILPFLLEETDYNRYINNIYPQITKDMLDELILHKLINKTTNTQLFEDFEFKFILNKTYTSICKIMNLYNVVYSKTKEKEDTQERKVIGITTKRAIIHN